MKKKQFITKTLGGYAIQFPIVLGDRLNWQHFLSEEDAEKNLRALHREKHAEEQSEAWKQAVSARINRIGKKEADAALKAHITSITGVKAFTRRELDRINANSDPEEEEVVDDGDLFNSGADKQEFMKKLRRIRDEIDSMIRTGETE